MKNVLVVVVCLLLVASAFALESGPSNKVGYVKVTIQANTPGTTTSVPFGLPFIFWSVPTGNIPSYGDTTKLPSMIVGTQAKCSSSSSVADNIVRQTGGASAWRNSNVSCAWTGSLQTSGTGQMIPGHAYWYRNRSGVLRYLVLAGEADTTAVGIPSRVINAPTPPATSANTAYSWREPRAVARNQLNLRAQGFTGDISASSSDQVAAQTGGTSCYYRTTDATWQGSLTALTPGWAYWIRNRHPAAWTYTYLANGQQLTMPEGGGDAVKQPAARTSVIERTAPPAQKVPSGTVINRK
ncbi:MAG: hypothetical protein NT025_05605 [bacterium]|nr:hypothetical protein [bacterium]